MEGAIPMDLLVGKIFLVSSEIFLTWFFIGVGLATWKSINGLTFKAAGFGDNWMYAF